MTLLMLKVMYYMLEVLMRNNSMLSQLDWDKNRERCGPQVMKERNDFRDKSADLFCELEQQIANIEPRGEYDG